MSILIQPTPTTPPKQVKLKSHTLRIKALAHGSYKNISEIQKRGIDMVWNNFEFTPQEIIDALGDDAINIFKYHGELTQYVIGLAQSEGITPDIKLPPNKFIVDEVNKTITVTDEPYTV
jgi:hypothetical protein